MRRDKTSQSFNEFFNRLISSANLRYDGQLSIPQARQIISGINEYLYTTYEGIGTTKALDSNFDYFSDFHKFWEKYHQEILQPTIDTEKCKGIARILDGLNIRNVRIFREIYETGSLPAKAICQIRYFAANQDFRGSMDFKKLRGIYEDDPTIFDAHTIKASPEDFLKEVGVTQLSQGDKRLKYAQTASQILIDLGIAPYDLFEYFK